jgi:ABC-type antimicrobial peptide transport system permease subunit
MLVALFVFMAAVMAGIVLMNLTNIYVLQKKRELTIMRVNGFTVKEVVGYLLRETLLTTALGILLGLAVGSGIAYRICRTMDQPFLQFVRDPSVPAWITGAVLTVLFTAVVNYVALRPVKDLKLTDLA